MTWRHAERRLDVLGLKWGLLALLKRDPRTQSEQNNIAICLTWEVWTERPTCAHMNRSNGSCGQLILEFFAVKLAPLEFVYSLISKLPWECHFKV